MPPLPWPVHDHDVTPEPPFASMADVLNNEYIPIHAEYHDINATRPVQGTSFAPNARRAGTIVCNGESSKTGSALHPLGNRTWTVRELAALQTFPAAHVFCEETIPGKAAMRIIGNAVPPLLAELMFEQIKASLEQTDSGQRPHTYQSLRAVTPAALFTFATPSAWPLTQTTSNTPSTSISTFPNVASGTRQTSRKRTRLPTSVVSTASTITSSRRKRSRKSKTPTRDGDHDIGLPFSAQRLSSLPPNSDEAIPLLVNIVLELVTRVAHLEKRPS